MQFEDITEAHLPVEIERVAYSQFANPAGLKMFEPGDALGVGLLRRMTLREHIDLWSIFMHQTKLLCEAALMCADSVDDSSVQRLAGGVIKFIRRMTDSGGAGAAQDAARAAAVNHAAQVALRLFWRLRKLDSPLHSDYWNIWESWDESRMACGLFPYAQTRIFEFLVRVGLGRNRIVAPYVDGVFGGVWWAPRPVRVEHAGESAVIVESNPDEIRLFVAVSNECLEPVALCETAGPGWHKIWSVWPTDQLEF